MFFHVHLLIFMWIYQNYKLRDGQEQVSNQLLCCIVLRQAGWRRASGRWSALWRGHTSSPSLAAFLSSICSSTLVNAMASHGSSSGPAAACPKASSASSSSGQNSGWLTLSVRTMNRCRRSPTYTKKQPFAGFLHADGRHHSTAFLITPLCPLSIASLFSAMHICTITRDRQIE
ncbi:hypothetical protein GUJ93_ZPchr0002g26473 [Zizania palustris]|uniref:Uncharacterized protein n=1 Tax=Zizania palustris TaxID=103762 RepID=A0A8J5RZT4_ZIZPA|nr:hypothetical protein GUJ93_ZPchr0002g26473 [Zizania palustris]